MSLSNQSHQNTTGELLSLHEKRVILARLARGHQKQKRHVKQQGNIVEVYDELSTSMLLRILALDTRLEARMEKQAAKEAKAAQQKLPAQPVAAVGKEVEPDAAEGYLSREEANELVPLPAVKLHQPAKLEVSIKEQFRRKAAERMAQKKAQKAG